MKNIVLVGAGGHAKSCIDIIEDTNKFKIKYLLEKKIVSQIFKYKKIRYTKKNLIKINNKIKYAFISFGQIKKKI